MGQETQTIRQHVKIVQVDYWKLLSFGGSNPKWAHQECRNPSLQRKNVWAEPSSSLHILYWERGRLNQLQETADWLINSGTVIQNQREGQVNGAHRDWTEIQTKPTRGRGAAGQIGGEAQLRWNEEKKKKTGEEEGWQAGGKNGWERGRANTADAGQVWREKQAGEQSKLQRCNKNTEKHIERGQRLQDHAGVDCQT